MAFNAYLLFKTGQSDEIKGESTSIPDKKASEDSGAIEVSDFAFGVSMPVTASRSDGGGATVGRANFEVFTCSKSIDTATCKLVEYCCKGTAIDKAILHLYRQGGRGGDVEESGTVKYAIVVFKHCVITKVGISGGGEELPKESLEFNYGICEYQYEKTEHDTGKGSGKITRTGWSTIKNKQEVGAHPDFTAFMPS